VTAIGGSIRVTSAPGQGTTFSVRVPGRQPDPAVSRARTRPQPSQPSAARPPASRAG
jgi:hypothetical protein